MHGPRTASLIWIRKSVGLFAGLGLVVSGLVPALPAFAAEAYDASVISLNAPSHIAPGQTATVSVTMKNIGTATWSNGGSHFVSIYAYDFIKRTEINSPLASPGWENPMRPVRLPVPALAPGKTVTFSFPVKASNQVGAYKGDFLLVAEGLRRMGNGRFSVAFTVDSPTAQVSSQQSVVGSPVPVITSTDYNLPPTASPGWQASPASVGGSEWQIEMEQNMFIELALKNTGTETWKREGGAFVSLYSTFGNKERVSPFKTALWSGNRAAQLVETEVKPGQIGHFKMEVRAPRSPGLYREEFQLAAENKAWISGSKITLPITVPMTTGFVATAPPGLSAAEVLSQSAVSRGGTYLANLLLRSLQSFTASGNVRQQVTLGFKNEGDSPWNSRSLKIKSVTPMLSGTLSSVRDDTWRDSGTPVTVLEPTKPGEVGFLTFYMKAPAKKGNYTASFQLYADNQAVNGGTIDIPITVTADGYIEPEPKPTIVNPTPTSPSVPTQIAPALNPQPLNGDPSTLPNEPIIRVGIFATTDDSMVISARYAPLEVRIGGSTGNVVCSLSVGQSVTVSFDRGTRIYRLSGACSGQSSTWYVVRALDGISAMEMSDFSRLVSWLPGANDNTFRGQLELRESKNGSEIWVINELPIEWYLKGIGETSNSSPQQYQRALLTAARTYAMYHVQRGTKHAAQNFTVDATYDQVYRGYGAELRNPAVVQAVDATRGQIVTYQGKLAITPYYSRSDGRTRSWTEVWGGSGIPWLVSVPVPDDIGRTLWGHGVGMSAMGALQMDAKWGKTYDVILAHFYTGTELRKAYK